MAGARSSRCASRSASRSTICSSRRRIPGEFDIVLCRNVLLYLSPEKKALAFERIAAAMAEDGWLMLGAGETVIGQTSKLGADLNARGLYRLVGDGSRVEKARRPRSAEPRPGLDPHGRAVRHCARWTWISSSALRPISTSARCRSR